MRWSFWRRNASRVALEASTPDLPLAPRSPSRPQCCATRRTTDSERWVLRLSQTMSHRVLAAALLSKLSRKRAKSCSVRLSPTTPATLPLVTSKPAIRACVPWRRYSNSRRSTLPGFIGNPGHAVGLRDAAMPICEAGGALRSRSSGRDVGLRNEAKQPPRPPLECASQLFVQMDELLARH